MLGMIGVIFHAENTAFRMLPNPTVFPWDTRSFSLRDILSVYTSALRDVAQVDLRLTREPVATIAKIASSVGMQFREDEQRQAMSNQEAHYSRETIAGLRAALTECNAHLATPDALPLVECVFRVHIEVVLEFLNDGCHDGDGQGAILAATSALRPPRETRGSTSPLATNQDETPPQRLKLADLDSASPKQRHVILVQLYIWYVRVKVVQTVGELRCETDVETINNVWCIIVFRMLFWLLLHDFHSNDIQLPKSGLFENRLPVYIS